ncbi:hypothetical protein [Niallia sp. 03133]|uniref:hypothetical protein n=1 Tax=Niallia sp. 03133 TaxID=3458060 RepID=UPI00404501AB
MKFNIYEGDKVIVDTGVIYKGEIVEVEEEGFWITEDYKTQEYIAFVEVIKIKQAKVAS